MIEVEEGLYQDLDNENWESVFRYCNGEHSSAVPVITEKWQEEPRRYEREHVDLIIAMADGDNDGPEWLGAFRMKGGMFMCIRAGCDYTGWG